MGTLIALSSRESKAPRLTRGLVKSSLSPMVASMMGMSVDLRPVCLGQTHFIKTDLIKCSKQKPLKHHIVYHQCYIVVTRAYRLVKGIVLEEMLDT